MLTIRFGETDKLKYVDHVFRKAYILIVEFNCLYNYQKTSLLTGR